MGLLRRALQRRRGRRDFGPPMGRPRMVPNIPAPIPPLEPFERLPFDDPRNDFMSIQRIEDVGVPGITPIEPVMPPPIPLPIPPVLPPVQSVTTPQPIGQTPRPVQGPVEMTPVQLPNLVTGELETVNIGNYNLPAGPVSPPTNTGRLITTDAPGVISAVPQPLQKMPLPPKRDDFMSIGGPGGGLSDLRQVSQIGREIGALGTGTPPPQTGLTAAELLQLSDEELQKYIPRENIGFGVGANRKTVDATPSPEEFRQILQSRMNLKPGDRGYGMLQQQTYRLQDAPSEFLPPSDYIDMDSFLADTRPDFAELAQLAQDPIGDPTITPAPTTPAAVADDVGAVPTTTIPADTRGQIDPVLAQQDTSEILSDPLLRALYFGTADQPGFINQLQQATQNVMGAELPSTQFDPSMTQQFFNPFEDRVVQQTIQDVMEAGEKRDIQQRARDIQTGGLSAFGSRARLTAADRQEALGRGLAEALGGIRRSGFSEAQRAALGQFGDQYARQMGQINRPIDLLTTVGRSLPGYGAQETRIDSQYRPPLDPTAAGLGAAFNTYAALTPKTGAA
jgi:hypothetical protein